MKIIYLAIVFAMIAVSCSDDPLTEQIALPSESKGIPTGTNMRVNHYTMDCYGERQGQCLLVQEGNYIGTDHWEYFYFDDGIEGFIFEPGFIYHLEVKKIFISDPPLDATAISCELIQILSKQKP